MVPVGQQIGLLIFSSDREFTLWPDPGTELTVDLGATSITLPIVGGLDGWKKSQTDKVEEPKEEKSEEKKSADLPSGPNSGRMWFNSGDEVLPLRLLPPDTRKGYKHHRGVISMPSSEIENPHKLASPYEFFIVQQAPGAYHLDGSYTVFGKVIAGMEVVDEINKQRIDNREAPLTNVIMEVSILQ